MHTLVVADHYIPADAYTSALAGELGADFGPVETVKWGGTKEEQHHLQQRMEWDGPNAVDPPSELLERVADVEVIVLHFAPIGAAVLAAAPRLRAVVVARAGVENVDLEAATAAGVVVANVAGRNASGVAELSIGLMLSEGRDIARADASIKTGGWRAQFPGPFTEIGGSTVGLVGFGHVGHHLAARLAGFGVRLLVADPYADPAAVAGYGGEVVPLDEVFRQADFISVQARVTPETQRFIGASQFALCKPTAYFVNVGRSRLVDYDALLDALTSGKIAGAGLDVYDSEPLPADSPFRSLDNVTMTTHFGGDTLTTISRSGALVAAAVAEFARTGKLGGAVNEVPGTARP